MINQSPESPDDWRQIGHTVLHPCYRDGWRGVWDALVSALFRRPRTTVTRPITFSLWVKSPHLVEVRCYGSQVEQGELWDEDDETWNGGRA